jgi:hypothetical protein
LRSRSQLRVLRLDTALCMLASEVTTWFIIVTTGSTLHAQVITSIQTADQAAQALTPLVRRFPHAGKLAGLIFAWGTIGTGLLAIPALAGSATYGVAEAFGWELGQVPDASNAYRARSSGATQHAWPRSSALRGAWMYAPSPYSGSTAAFPSARYVTIWLTAAPLLLISRITRHAQEALSSRQRPVGLSTRDIFPG